METGRRFFLSGFLAILAGSGGLTAAGQRHGNPDQPGVQIPDASDSGRGADPVQPPRADPKVQLKEDQKTLRHDVDRLLDMVKELKAESDNTPETEVLSLSLVKKTENIEKLARQIRDLIRAS